ncbi:hypothetical protein AUK40_02445 [Candidatus Wirthbacteria bacterium CG2_30_54_11]|uniref:Cell shape determination protein CcmA n=1 Tax=Candidatus Wirthbacteria bacterium CG2_30_54_11 TaxID=1817892 RepID=A0A1J5ITW1_9BACT|nr:MAG: hypothetical protein AUK40_02445 [Candidatus Wirthbacteria bacterium CG2_30_54_11]
MAKIETGDTYVNILGQGTTLKGDIRFDEHTFINGEAVGSIQVKGELVIGENARIKAGLKATSIQVRGEVEGTIECEGVLVVANTAHITGDVATTLLRVEEGGIIQGKITMNKQHDQMDMLPAMDDQDGSAH